MNDVYNFKRTIKLRPIFFTNLLLLHRESVILEFESVIDSSFLDFLASSNVEARSLTFAYSVVSILRVKIICNPWKLLMNLINILFFLICIWCVLIRESTAYCVFFLRENFQAPFINDQSSSCTMCSIGSFVPWALISEVLNTY